MSSVIKLIKPSPKVVCSLIAAAPCGHFLATSISLVGNQPNRKNQLVSSTTVSCCSFSMSNRSVWQACRARKQNINTTAAVNLSNVNIFIVERCIEHEVLNVKKILTAIVLQL